MENFIVSARKYRPVIFDDVVGQESITLTLKNAIKTNHLAQAYLFCGPRGVGKTTCARILAKTINCQNLTDKIEACGKCESCQAFDSSRSYNIHELDAASNNKVDDIRTLTDQVKIPPQVGRYSVYIIDEVHMLSTSAFNAFLKTLEEPPPHAVFILATTEKQKIIPTILSRCQIFDFHRITIDDIVNRLQYVAEQENVKAEQEALQIIAQKSDGSMRDALSILDQIVSYKGKTITYADVIENLNVLDYEYYLRATDAFLSGDVASSLLLFNDILDKGFDGHNFIAGLSSHFRNLLVCKDEVTLKLVEAGSAIRSKYREQTLRCPLEFLYKGLEILSACDIYYRTSKNQKLHVELALIKLAVINSDNSKKQAANEVKDDEKPGNIITAESKKRPSDREDIKIKEEQAPPKKNEYSPAKSFSIKERLKKQQENSDAAVLDEDKDDYSAASDEDNKEFDESELTEAWKSFGDTLKKGNPRMSSIIKAMKPVIEDNSEIILELSNKAQKDYFDQKYKHDMVSHLKRELSNSKIVFHTRVSEKKDNSTPYTEEEKYKYLADKNPAVDKLRNEFGLEFD
ncbi:MAG: DNA polymerase III subunit gamma/tau [Bacteroidales bacterium]|jgi:DNA polymerase-3 subunit gamma/tau|nr:DNA polymerase III subunit gamma/tau [Bacteroidales bacterium]